FRLGRSSDINLFAEKVISNSLASQEEKVVAQYYKGKNAYAQGNLEEAFRSFSIVESGASNHQAAEARYLMAEIYFKQGNLEKAEEQCNITNAKSSNYPSWIAKSLILISDIKVKQ